MEWLGVLLLYLISGFVKKRQQSQKRKEIESDPDWDSSSDINYDSSDNSLGRIMNDLFEDNPIIPEPSEEVRDTVKEESKTLVVDEISSIEDNSIVSVDGSQVESFQDKIYHSKLADKEELQLGNKWQKSRDIKKELFNSKMSLKRSVILKEILDEPLAYKK